MIYKTIYFFYKIRSLKQHVKIKSNAAFVCEQNFSRNNRCNVLRSPMIIYFFSSLIMISNVNLNPAMSSLPCIYCKIFMCHTTIATQLYINTSKNVLQWGRDSWVNDCISDCLVFGRLPSSEISEFSLVLFLLTGEN